MKHIAVLSIIIRLCMPMKTSILQGKNTFPTYLQNGNGVLYLTQKSSEGNYWKITLPHFLDTAELQNPRKDASSQAPISRSSVVP